VPGGADSSDCRPAASHFPPSASPPSFIQPLECDMRQVPERKWCLCVASSVQVEYAKQKLELLVVCSTSS